MSLIRVGTRAFPISPNPPAGKFFIGLNSSNSDHLSIQNSSGTVIDLQSGAVYTDSDAVAAVYNAWVTNTDIAIGGSASAPQALFNFHTATAEPFPAMDDQLVIRDASAGNYKRISKTAVLQSDPNRYFQFQADFLGTALGDLTSYASGSGASTQIGTYGQDLAERALGVSQSDTGSTATGRAGLGTASMLALAPSVARYKICVRTAFEALSTPTDRFTWIFGLTDAISASGQGTNGIGFRYSDDQNSGRVECFSRGGAVDLATFDTGLSADVDFHVYEVRLNEAGDTAEFYVDGALITTFTGGQIPLTTQRFGFGYKIEKSVGTNQRNISTDWIYFESERSSDR